MTHLIDQIHQAARRDRRRIILAEAHDPRVIAAAEKLAQDHLVEVVLVNPPRDRSLSPAIQTIAVDDPLWSARAAERLWQNRAAKGLTQAGAVEAAQDPVMFAALLLALDYADGAVAGSLATTAHVLRCGLHAIGTLPGKSLVSSFFLMQSPSGQCVAFADCAVVPDPSAEQLAEIAEVTAQNYQQLTAENPRIALLSFSTRGSAEHPAVTKVRQATEHLRNNIDREEGQGDVSPASGATSPTAPKGSRTTWQVDGELQFDAAWVPNIGQRKAPGSAVAGQANVLIFPDLNSGNIGYKIAERLGGFQAIGPIIQGLKKPLMDLSRGCSVDDIVNVATIASRISAASIS